jgi:hypothetical protein
MNGVAARVLSPLLLLLFLAACGGEADDSGSAAGSWTLDRERTRESAFHATKKQIEETRKQLERAPQELRDNFEEKVPKGDDALRKDVADKTEKLTLELELRADGTTRLVMKGPSAEGPREETHEGTWEEKGREVLVTGKTRNGEPVPEAGTVPQRFARRDGRLVFLDPSGNDLFWLRRK